MNLALNNPQRLICHKTQTNIQTDNFILKIIISTQLKCFKYFSLTLIILFNINHLFAESFRVSSNDIQRQYFAYS